MEKRTFPLILLSLFPLLLSSPAIVHAQWEPDVRLTVNDAVSQSSSIAASGDTVHVVWFDSRDGNLEIYYKRSRDGGSTWGADTRLTWDSSGSYKPAVASQGASVHMVWEDNRDNGSIAEIYYKRTTDAGNTWSSDLRLSRNDSLWSEAPSVGVSGPMVHVTWWDGRDGNSEIYYRRSSDNGMTWGQETRLTYDYRVSTNPQICVSQGTVCIVWDETRDNDTYQVYLKRSTDSGLTWGQDTRLTTYPGDYERNPSVAISDSIACVVWFDFRDGSSPEIYYTQSSDGGLSWSQDTRLTYAPGNSSLPCVAVSNTNVHVAWFDYRDSNDEIYYNLSTDGGLSWGRDTRLSYDPNYSLHASISVSGSKVHVAWDDWRAGNWEIYYKRNPTGNSGVEESISSSPISHFPFSVHPNPFISYATVPGHSTDRFALYDVSGRRVGTYRGDRIGEGLRAGVYFVRSSDQNGKSLRVVKVR